MQIVQTSFLSQVKKLSLQHICRTKPTSYIMLIALLSILLILCAVLLLSYLLERRKCLRMQKRLFRESIKNKLLSTHRNSERSGRKESGRLIAMPQRIIGRRRLRYSCLLRFLSHTLRHPSGFRTKKRLHRP